MFEKSLPSINGETDNTYIARQMSPTQGIGRTAVFLLETTYLATTYLILQQYDCNNIYYCNNTIALRLPNVATTHLILQQQYRNNIPCNNMPCNNIPCDNIPCNNNMFSYLRQHILQHIADLSFDAWETDNDNVM